MLNIYQLLDGMPRLSQRLKTSSIMVSIICCNDLFHHLLILPVTLKSVLLFSLYQRPSRSQSSNFCGQDLSKFGAVIFNHVYYSFADSLLPKSNCNILLILQTFCLCFRRYHDFLTVNPNLADSKVSRIVNAVEKAFALPQTLEYHPLDAQEIHKKPRPSSSIKRSCLSILASGLSPLSL